MTVSGDVPGDEVPEADWAEQVTEAKAPVDDGPAAGTSLDAASREANEADLVEQELSVDFDDDEQ